MLKQFIILLILSVLAVMFMSEVHHGLQYLTATYGFVTEQLSHVFSSGRLGSILSGTITLVIIPIVIGLIVNFIYWLVKRSTLPILIPLIWVVWVLLIALIG